MFRLFVLLIFLLSPGCSLLKFDSISLHSGYSVAAVKGDDIQAVPNLVRADWRITQIDPKHGRLTVGLEGSHYRIRSPRDGTISGLTPLVRYTYPVNKWLGVYAEGGAGPIYLGAKTYEQEKAGFSFLDQVGAGIELSPNSRWALMLGYRFSHISHAGLRNTRNRGIENNTALFGIQLRFP